MVALTLTACGVETTNQKEELVNNKPKIEHLMGEIKHGLNRVTIDDTTTILIYRGVESCTMIEIK